MREALRALTAGPDAEPAMVPIEEAEVLLPIAVGDYVDFYRRSITRRTSGGCSAPTPNRCCPTGATAGRLPRPRRNGGRQRYADPRPRGQRREPGDEAPSSVPACGLDIELELGFVVGVPSALGEPVAVEHALDHVFGVLLVNDWSARDLQAWEYRPLGPFLAKSFATSVAAWVTPLEAVLGRRVVAPAQEPAPLPYLREEPWALDLDLEIELNGAVVARTNARHLYCRPPQRLAHMTVNGASLSVGDLCASGTISGPQRDQRGSLLELSWNGTEPIVLADGSERASWRTATRSSCAAPARRRAVPRRGPRADRAGGLMALPKAIRRLTPDRLRDDVRLRSIFVGAGLIPPRTMHSEHDAAVLRATAAGRRRVVELGVYEGSSAVVLCEVLDPGADLHLVDPFGHHGWALPAGWGGDPRAPAAASWPGPRAITPGRECTGTSTTAPPSPNGGRATSTSSSSTATTARQGVRANWKGWHGFVGSPAARCCSTTRGRRRRAGAGCRGRLPWWTRCSAGLRRWRGGGCCARPIARWRSSARSRRRRSGDTTASSRAGERAGRRPLRRRRSNRPGFLRFSGVIPGVVREGRRGAASAPTAPLPFPR